jgi:CheY-like chemotaxis protein
MDLKINCTECRQPPLESGETLRSPIEILERCFAASCMPEDNTKPTKPKPDHSEGANLSKCTGQALSDKPTKTILLVDDHEPILRLLHNYLEKKGYNVLEAQSGEEALLVAECFPAMIHILVTDLIMARMNGRELARQLTELRPEMQVIIMSGFPDQVMAQQELTTEIPILAKPFVPQRLLTAIEMCSQAQNQAGRSPS